MCIYQRIIFPFADKTLLTKKILQSNIKKYVISSPIQEKCILYKNLYKQHFKNINLNKIQNFRYIIIHEYHEEKCLKWA